MGLQVFSSHTIGIFTDCNWCPSGDNVSAIDTTSGAHVDHVIGVGDDVQVVFDGNDRGALLNQLVEDFD